MKIKRVLILGCGYVGEKLARASMEQGMEVVASTRDECRANELRSSGIEAVIAPAPDALPETLLSSVDAVVDSIPLTRDETGMHASQVEWLPEIASKFRGLKWAAYLSTTGVYGDADGAWVDESFPCNPSSERGRQRLVAEQAWLDSGLPAEVFRLAGIYGSERNIISRLKAGGYKAIEWNPPHYSSRIHVDDIVASLLAAMRLPRSGRIANLADDFPCPHAEYVTELAKLIGAPAPELLSPEEGEKELSPAMLDFFRDSKRVSNQLLHRELLPKLEYPNFRDAVESLSV
ncbi:MAG: SDR family oxidoreductase [Mariprofundaceae bacterium]